MLLSIGEGFFVAVTYSAFKYILFVFNRNYGLHPELLAILRRGRMNSVLYTWRIWSYSYPVVLMPRLAYWYRITTVELTNCRINTHAAV